MKYYCYKCKCWKERECFSESGIRNETANICKDCSRAAAKAWHKKRDEENKKYKDYFNF